jgi:site-specific DNA recombinase
MDVRSALINCRVSTKGQEEDGTSLESQEAACIEHAQSLGFTSWRVTREVYTGAELYDRPLLSRDRADLKSGQFQALIAYSTDRLSRKAVHIAMIAEDCQRHGVALIFVTEPLDNSPVGQLIAYVQGFAADIEREKIKERSVRGKRQRALNGKIHNFAPELYGYRRDKATGKRVIYEPEAAIVRLIFDLIVNERIGATAAATRLNKRGIPPASTGKYSYSNPDRQPIWRAPQIGKMVRHPAYKGETYAWVYRTPTSAQERLSADYDVARNKMIRPESEWIRLPDDVTPPIVSPELWQQAQDVLSGRHGEATRNEKHPHPLRGFVYCAVCGRRMYSDAANTRRGVYVQIYTCSSRQRVGKSCGVSRVLASELEPWVWEKVSDALRHPEMVAAELERRRAEGPDETLASDLETARREYTKCDQNIAKLLRRYTASESDDDRLWKAIEREIALLENGKARYLDTIAEIERRMAEQRQSVVQLSSLVDYCARVSQNLDRFGFEEKRMAYEALQVRITANGADWTLLGSIPLDRDDALEADAPVTSGEDARTVFPTQSQQRRDDTTGGATHGRGYISGAGARAARRAGHERDQGTATR